MKPNTETAHAARAAQKTQAHKAGEGGPKPGKPKRKESRAWLFDVKSKKDWMFPANKTAKTLLSYIAATLIFALASCHEHHSAPTISERLDGYWTGGAWNHQGNLYHFHDGAAWAAKVVFGEIVERKDYAYGESGDTLKMLDALTFERSAFVVSFPTDSTVTLERVGGLKINLKKAE